MPRQFAHTLHALVAALALVVISSAFAQTKPPALIGKSRSEVVAQLGEPKSNIKAGAREMLFFEHLKVTFRNDIAIETEVLADEPTPPPAPAPTPKRPADTSTTASATNATPAAPSATTAQPATTAATAQDAAGSGATKSTASDAAAVPAKPAAKQEPTLLIKSVKSGGAAKSAPRPAAEVPPPAAPVAPATVETKAAPAANVASSDSRPASQPAADAKSKAATATPASSETAKETSTTTATTETPAAEETPAKPAVDPKKKAAVRHRWRLRRDAETEEEGVIYIPIQSYVIAFLTIAAGVGFLWWRFNQRKLLLAATAVSQTPFESASPADTSAMFSAELIGKLGHKKFERLVASYYAKTGVVAERTNAGLEAAVHIKIFWKGEPKPFAGVQCHANPTGLIGPQRLQELFTELTAADIRRGYVVTTGKFSVEARDVAEEKHFTLLSGDIFLEKLNALPPAARGELLKETSIEEPTPPPPAVIT